MGPLGYDPAAADSGVRLVIVGGPNASGKSTLTDELRKDREFPAVYINADEIAKSEALASISDYGQRNLKAAQIAEQRRRDALASGRPFAFESVLSTPGGIAIITEARTKGYEVQAALITTESANINVARNVIRVEKGGHTVPDEKIRSRYEAAMLLLPHVVDHANRADIFDSSKPNMIEWIAHKSSSILERRAQPAPEWYVQRLEVPYRALIESKTEIAEEFRAHKLRNGLKEGRILVADASHGRQYTGAIIVVTDKHILQSATAGIYVLHDRVFTPDREFRIGEQAHFHYQYNAGKLVELKSQSKEIER